MKQASTGISADWYSTQHPSSDNTRGIIRRDPYLHTPLSPTITQQPEFNLRLLPASSYTHNRQQSKFLFSLDSLHLNTFLIRLGKETEGLTLPELVWVPVQSFRHLCTCVQCAAKPEYWIFILTMWF